MPLWVVVAVVGSVVAGLLMACVLIWFIGPVSDELRAFRIRGGYFGNRTEWTLAKRWVAFWYWRDKP